MRKVLIVDDVYESLIHGLENNGFEVIYLPNINKSAVADKIKDVQPEGIVVRSKILIERPLLDYLDSVKWVARAGAGIDNIDQNYLNQKNIEIFDASGANANSVAEHMLGMLLSYLHKIPSGNDNVKSGNWDREYHRGVELKGKKVGIIGYGHTGSALGNKLMALGANLLVYDKYKDIEDLSQLESVEFNELCEKADVISVHVPLTEETRGWFSKPVFSNMRCQPIFMNASRGETMIFEDVVDAIEKKQLSAALLDVFPFEPISKIPRSKWAIWDTFKVKSNVMFSPHVAGWSVESYRNISDFLLSKILNYKG